MRQTRLTFQAYLNVSVGICRTRDAAHGNTIAWPHFSPKNPALWVIRKLRSNKISGQIIFHNLDSTKLTDTVNFNRTVSPGDSPCVHGYLAVLSDMRADGFAINVLCPRLCGEEQEDGEGFHFPSAALMPSQTAPTKPVAITVTMALNV